MRGWPEDPATEVARCSWPAALRAAITGEELRCYFQPIVDVDRGAVVGYEALARMEGPAGPVGPTPWFTAARVHGMSADLEAACLVAAFSQRSSLPDGCFLSVNVGPHVLAHDAMRRVLEAEGDLTGVVLELTEHTSIDRGAALHDDLAGYRRAGAVVAVDDTGAGQAGRLDLEALQPSIVKMDRELVASIHLDPHKRTRVRELAAFAQRVGASVLAEGVESLDELHAVAELPVTLVQGYVIAKPSPPWPDVAPELIAQLRRRRADATAGVVRAGDGSVGLRRSGAPARSTR